MDNNPNQGFFLRGGVKCRQGMDTGQGELWAGNLEQ